MYSPLKISHREADLNGRGYSASDERRILNALGRGLLKEPPNPERVGCPGADVVKRIASHEMPLSEAEKWLDHLGSCSPCYADFKRFTVAHEWRRKRTWFAAAAGIMLGLAVAGWALFHNRNENLTAQTAVLDLRDRSPARGTEANPAEPPLEIQRNAAHLEIYPPLGSSEGLYDVRIASTRGESLLTETSEAKIDQGVTKLRVDLRTPLPRPGNYLLLLRRPTNEWVSFPLRVR